MTMTLTEPKQRTTTMLVRVTIPLPGNIAYRDWVDLIEGVEELLLLAAQLVSIQRHNQNLEPVGPTEFVTPDQFKRDLRLRYAHYGSDAEMLVAIVGVSAALMTAIGSTAAVLIDKVRQRGQPRAETDRIIAETERLRAETRRLDAERRRLESEEAKLRSEIAHLRRPKPLGQAERGAFREMLAEALDSLPPEERVTAFEQLLQRPRYQPLRFLAEQQPKITVENPDERGRTEAGADAPSH